MKKQYIVMEQILFVIMYVLLFTQYPERFASVNIFAVILPMSFGVLLSRLVFYIAEKYMQGYGKIKVNIIQFVLLGLVLSLSIFATSYFGNEPISFRTFIFLVLTFEIYLYISRFSVLGFQKLIESNDIDEDANEIVPTNTIDDYFDIIDEISINFELAILQEHKKAVKDRYKFRKRVTNDDLELGKEEIKRETELVIKMLKYIDACSEQFKEEISSYEKFKDIQSAPKEE